MALNYEPAEGPKGANRLPLVTEEYNEKSVSSPSEGQGISETEPPGPFWAGLLINLAKRLDLSMNPNAIADRSGSPWPILLRHLSGAPGIPPVAELPAATLTEGTSLDVLVFREGIGRLGGRTMAPASEQDIPATTAFEQWYDLLSKWAVAHGSRELHDQLMEIWRTSGERGAFWLIQRLLIEKQIDVQEATLEALVEIGRPAIPYVIGSLAQPSQTHDIEHTTLLLRALRWFSRDELSAQLDMIPRLIQQFLQSSDRELKEAAYRCTEILPKQQAIDILTTARSSEPASDLQEVIDGLLEEADHR